MGAGLAYQLVMRMILTRRSSTLKFNSSPTFFPLSFRYERSWALLMGRIASTAFSAITITPLYQKVDAVCALGNNGLARVDDRQGNLRFHLHAPLPKFINQARLVCALQQSGT